MIPQTAQPHHYRFLRHVKQEYWQNITSATQAVEKNTTIKSVSHRDPVFFFEGCDLTLALTLIRQQSTLLATTDFHL
jgi:hypothetical protein